MTPIRFFLFLSLFLTSAFSAMAETTLPPDYAPEASSSDIFSQANELYRNNETEKAIAGYLYLNEHGAANGYLFYNLGNAYFLQGQLGDAILWYERAKRYLPRFEDLEVNLTYARNQIVDEIAAPPKHSGTLGLFLWIYDSFNPNELAWIALAGLWLWVLSLSGILWLNQPNQKAWLRVPCWLGGLAFIIFVSCAAAKVYDFETWNEGIVTSSAVEIKTAPGSDFSTAFSLHEGAKVRIVQRQNDWVQIRLPGDAAFTGWMPYQSVQPIEP
ncbi:MAG: hypothetical protein P9L94_10890 [Candidatus Hinthialibacter antarcticus]|nr:hypothetical protein [Candidatus Hinthialibacter antarcticus]